MADLAVTLTAPNGTTYEQPTGLFINNEFIPAASGSTVVSIDPTTEKDIVAVSAGEAADVDKAVKAAYAALRDPSWKKLPAHERGQLMAKLADKIEENRELLATVETWDNGKAYTDAVSGDLNEAIGVIRYYAGWCDKISGQTIALPNKFAYTLRQPIGVVGQIIPWNYPLSMATWKLGPALACGNTVVLKPAEQTPLSALILARLIRESGFPPGVVNVVNGLGKDAGAALVQHPLVDKVAFTGSTATATQIMKMAAGTLKNITLETGGKSPLLVFADADIEQAVKWAHLGIMSNQGQICTATSRILVQDSIHDEFVRRFVEETKKTSIVGNPFDAATYQGPQVNQAQYKRVLSYIESGRASGATVATGGNAITNIAATGGKGYFIQPTLFTHVTGDMPIWQEEIFGPVAVLGSFTDEADAISKANNTVYGLGAAVFTKDLERAVRVAEEIEAGMVWINSSQDCDPRVPFGGVKQSGIGRELGEAGLEAYSQIKAVHVNMGSRL